METSKLLESTLELFDRYKIALVLGLAGLFLVGLGFLLPNLKTEKKPIVIENSASEKIVGIKVDIEGAVKNPGVYSLGSGSRILDVIESAGGFTEKTDSDWLTKNINLAAVVKDGDKIYINSLGEAPIRESIETLGVATAKININKASSSQLDTLPGIGPATATKIISKRPYNSIEELLSKKAVGSATYNKIKDLVSVN